MTEVIELNASFDDGKLLIERRDGQPISIITHEETESGCIEVVEFGCRGNAVKALQSLLNCHGQHLDVDGIFGNCTQTSLLIFQHNKKLPETGVCSSLDWGELVKGN